jgi:hypothetical protein
MTLTGIKNGNNDANAIILRPLESSHQDGSNGGQIINLSIYNELLLSPRQGGSNNNLM